MNILNEVHPERTIIKAIDYSDKWFIFSAVENVDEIDYNDPFYAVNKYTGSVRAYSPMADLANFIDALNNRSLDIL